MSKNVLRKHYAKLFEILSVSKESLFNLSASCYENELIDLQLKSVITNSDGNVGANKLLDHLEMKIKQSKKYLPVVLNLMDEETTLKDVVKKMKEFVELGNSENIEPEEGE